MKKKGGEKKEKEKKSIKWQKNRIYYEIDTEDRKILIGY